MRVALIGATGYLGIELARLLSSHPHMRLETAISLGLKERGQPPLSLQKTNYYVWEELTDERCLWLTKHAELVFTALPASVSMHVVPKLLEHKMKVIDLSGAFRLKDRSIYSTYYQIEASDELDRSKVLYGLCEKRHLEREGVDLIANPGCYPTAALLGLQPIVQTKKIDPASIVIDAKSGASGAGGQAKPGLHFAYVNENFYAYKVHHHQHRPEIEQELSLFHGSPIEISFTTHLLPITRGILCTIYARLNKRHTAEELFDLYQDYYKKNVFVTVCPLDHMPSIKEVACSNRCAIGLAVDLRLDRVTLVVVIDNLLKGGSGQAIQNANLWMGWPEESGLPTLPIYP